MTIHRVCVYCASSRAIHPEYHTAAYEVGQTLATAGITISYGGGGAGSMGHLADGALAVGGRVEGVIPTFMVEREWAHEGITELQRVEDMHTRKELMIRGTDAVIALPGGTGTFEELFEALTWKRLGTYTKPIVLVNTRGYFGPCLQLLERCISEKFIAEDHRAMWTVVDRPEEVLTAIESSPRWDVNAPQLAAR